MRYQLIPAMSDATSTVCYMYNVYTHVQKMCIIQHSHNMFIQSHSKQRLAVFDNGTLYSGGREREGEGRQGRERGESEGEEGGGREREGEGG